MRTLGFLKTQRGINMVEVLVTIVITSVGLLGLNSLQLQASRSTLDSGNRSQAVWVLEDLTNRMRANLVGIDGYDTGGTKTCGTAPKICSSHHNGSNKVIASNSCSAEEQAESDLHEVLCGFGSQVAGSEVTFSSAANFLANPDLNVVINANKNATITLSWDVRTSGLDSSGEAVYTADSSNVATQRNSITTEVHP